MKTERKDYGPFRVVKRTIRAELKFGPATLNCDVQKGTLPLGTKYRTRPQWYIKFDGSPCAIGPWKAEAIREYYAK